MSSTVFAGHGAARAARWTASAPVALQPFGSVHPRQLALAARIVARVFSAPTVTLAPLAFPDTARTSRGQWDADILLEELHLRLPERCLRVVGVAEEDLAVSGRTFVFGYAHLTDGMAIYSTARLRESWYGRGEDAALLARRVLRTLGHELGHTFGTPHCEEPRCLMRAVSYVETLDALPVSFCAGCRTRVQNGLKRAPWSPRGRWDRGMAWLRRREWGKAVVQFESAVRAAPLESRYQHALALARAGHGDEIGARRALARAAELAAEAHAHQEHFAEEAI